MKKLLLEILTEILNNLVFLFSNVKFYSILHKLGWKLPEFLKLKISNKYLFLKYPTSYMYHLIFEVFIFIVFSTNIIIKNIHA